MIQVDNLSIAYHGNPLFQSASFSVQAAERCGIVGRNGAGKTTLFRLLLGEETPDSGSVAIAKQYLIGTLRQHSSFIGKTLIDEASLALPADERERPYRVEAILFGLGFKESDMERPPADFSGGYQLRLHLAKLLVQEPNCLLLDEPTNYLDIVSIRWLTRFLQQWRGELLLISHDREFMDQVCTHTMGIHRAKIRKIKGGTGKYFEALLQEEEIHEKTRLNAEKKRAHLQSFIDRFGAKATKAAQAQARQKMIDKIPALDKLKAMHCLDFAFATSPYYGKKMIDVHNMAFKYGPDEPLIVQDLSFDMEKGERVAIIGKNGRGKSTLLKLIAGELDPLAGSIKKGDNLSIGYFGQTNIERLHKEHTIIEEIQFANPQLSQTDVRGICGVMLFSGDEAEKPIGVLSGGERSRVLLGKILATPCNMLLLDEPTHHLDMESIEALVEAIEDFEGSVIFVTHSELILRQLDFHKIILCSENGQEVFLGNYSDFLLKKGWDETDIPKAKRNSTSLKEEKARRADLINKRSQALKPLNTKIATLEKEISCAEITLDHSQQALITASQNNASNDIRTLSITIASQQSKINDLYSQLETLLLTKESTEAQFDTL
jgi:ATP-binding cassette subfamily F protein 3